MNINAKKAQDKLFEEYTVAKLGKRAQVIAHPTLEALKNFCEQNEEFAQAVLQTDQTFAECVECTVKNAGNAISDIEVYRKAVEFYFPGAKVNFKMTIDLGDEGFSNSAENTDKLDLSLDSLLDF